MIKRRKPFFNWINLYPFMFLALSAVFIYPFSKIKPHIFERNTVLPKASNAISFRELPNKITFFCRNSTACFSNQKLDVCFDKSYISYAELPIVIEQACLAKTCFPSNLAVLLYIEKNVKMGYLEGFRQKLSECGIKKVYYLTS